MADISIRIASTEAEFDQVRGLCRQWLDWHWRNYPADWPVGDDHPMDRDRFAAILPDLPALHARPTGAMFLATLDGEPVGCVMYHEAAPGVAEFKRMFVGEAARGHRIGRRMLDRMLEQMIDDGYRSVLFSSATFLSHARTMYRDAGFVDRPHPDGFPGHWRPYVYFMERPLTA